MDPIKAQKRRTINSHKQKKLSHQFFQSLIVHSLIAVTCSLLCSFSYSFPSLYTIKHLLFISLPNSWSGSFNPNCLFIVVNFIVVFLIGESRLSGKQSSLAAELYNEYVERSRSIRRPFSTFQEKKRIMPAILNENEDNAKRIEDKEVDESKEDKHDDHEEDFKECEGNDEVEKHEENEEVKEEQNEENEEVKEEQNEENEEVKEEEKREENEADKDEEKEEQEEEAGRIPAEDLNRRVEDFIARVNKQRSLEARFLVCR